MRFAYADPPYPGQSEKHYADHEDYDGEVDLGVLAERLRTYDGWVFHTSVPALHQVIQEFSVGGIDYRDYRVMAWVKPFAAFKKNVPVAYAWEPVLIKPVRKPVVSGRVVMRDWIAEPMTMQRGLVGAKPDAVCRWVFELAGLTPNDTLVDLFPGSGAVTRAWQAWRSQPSLFEPLEQVRIAEAIGVETIKTTEVL